jgi:hypothetical protein
MIDTYIKNSNKHIVSQAYSIFQQPWWLDAVAPSQWNEVNIKVNGNIIARMPYVIRNKYGYKFLVMPPLTPHLGPWMNTDDNKYARKISKQKKIMTELITKLPAFDSFDQNFHFSIFNWQPFYWQGFIQTTLYTYVLEDISDHDKTWNGLMPNIRREIKKAINRYEVEVCNDNNIKKFLTIHKLTFLRQNMEYPYPKDLIHRINSACQKQKVRKIFFAKDIKNEIHAAVYLVWDENSAYYLMGGTNPETRTSGASSLCMWEAIKFASTVTKSFNFEGSMIESIEHFFRSFGARQIPYFRIIKTNSKLLKIARIIGITKNKNIDV